MRNPHPMYSGTAVLLLLGDGRFPGGGHAHSGGLEAAVAEGRVTGASGLRAFLEGKLHTTGVTDAWLAAAACAGADPSLMEAECEARCPSPALRAAGRALGRGLRRAAARSWPEIAGVGVEQHPVVLGLVARAAGLAPAGAASLAVHGMLAGGASAAVRLLPLDMADAMAVVAGLAPEADAVAAEAAALALEDGPARSAPVLERRAEEHARWEVRLFAS
ncbi:MAG TPA: urease accessory UreF family protein [Acidimicrobiales bacterium]|nr:urease accessory UreF family protein [Acidimicrobiales bacterium]